MCTVSWAVQKDGYRLFFNRDEQRTRATAEPPFAWDGPDGPFLAPRDPDGGGTWITVNARGWTLAVLNFYARAGVMPPGNRSRGELLVELAGAHALDFVRKSLAAMELDAFAPFYLLVVNPQGEGHCFIWDGIDLTEEPTPPERLPLSTSSRETDRVLARRKAIFDALNAGGPPSAESLVAFHRHFDQSDGSASVCMRREDAQTVSLSDIAVGKRKVVFRYFPRDSEGAGFGRVSEQTMPRA